jgi:hypothetical protein
VGALSSRHKRAEGVVACFIVDEGISFKFTIFCEFICDKKAT